MKTRVARLVTEVAPCPTGGTVNEVDRGFADRSETLTAEDRRSFLGFLTGLIGLCISSVLGVTLGRFSIVPALSAANISEWIEVGSLESIPSDKPVNRTLLVSQNAGWGRFISEQSVWIVKKEDEVTVFSSVCPHLGCTINENSSGFGCVCHNSSWRRTGEISGGPAPRGMDSLEHKIENGTLKVKYQTFKQGVVEKITAG
jgi:Rieske Fe-S protein